MCCQQYASSVRSTVVEASLLCLPFELAPAKVDAVGLAILRLHSRPADVRPAHVPAGFLESKRARRDSGVLGMNGIVRDREELEGEGRNLGG